MFRIFLERQADSLYNGTICIGGNWRLTFMFEDEAVILVDYRDYHCVRSKAREVNSWRGCSIRPIRDECSESISASWRFRRLRRGWEFRERRFLGY